MRFVALDLDKKTALATIFDHSQAQLDQKRVGLERTSLTAFKNTLLPEDVLCLEACPGSYYVAEFLQPAVSDVALVNPNQFGRIIEANKQKTDRNDSGLMCRLFMARALPLVWLPNKRTREERLYSEHCRSLDSERTRQRNRVHAFLTEYGLGPEAEELLKKDVHLLLARLSGALPELVYDAVAGTLRLLQQTEDELRTARARISMRIKDRESTELACSIPGIDDYLAFIITSNLGDISRFKTAASVANYAGVTPSLHSSGTGKPKHGRITKRGSRSLRWAAIEAAANAVRTPGRFKTRYTRLLRKGKGRNKALLAVARDLLEILWHLLTRGEKYRDVTPAFQERKNQRRAKKHAAASALVHTAQDPRQSIAEGLSIVRDVLDSMAA